MTDPLEEISRLNAIEAQRRAAGVQEQAAREQTEAAKSIKSLIASVKTITGSDGPQGPQGPQGARGGIGPQGLRGSDGSDGRDGKPGSPGSKGDKGDKGADGVGPDEKVRLDASDPASGFLTEKLTPGYGIKFRTEQGKSGSRIVIDAPAPPSSGGGGGGMALIGIRDDGATLGQATIIDFGDNLAVSLAAGIATVTGAAGAGGGAVASVNGATGVVVLSASDVGAQPADSDLTAIAALTTTAYGRAFLDLADAAAGRTALGLGTAAVAASGDFDPAGAAAAAQGASQPLDSDLSALAALTTTAYGRSLLETANAAALRTLAGLGSAAVAATGDFDAAGAAAAAQSASQPLDSDLTAIAALTTTALGRSLLAAADAAAIRTISGAEASGAAAAAQAASQPLDSDLTAIAALTTTSFGRSRLTEANAAAARAALALGTLATQSGTFSGTSSGTNTGDEAFVSKAKWWTD